MFKSIFKLKQFLFNSKKELIIILVFSVLSTLIMTLNPYVYGMILNNMLNTNYNFVFMLVIIVGFIHIILTLLNLFVSKNYLLLRKKMVFNIRKKAYNRLINLDIETLKNNQSGAFLNKVKDDSIRVSTYLNSIKECIFIAFGNLATIFVIIYLNYIIGIYYLICLIILLMIRYYGIKKSIHYKYINLEYLDSNATLLNETIKGANDIKLLNLKNSFISKTDDSFENIGALEYKSISYIEYTVRITRFLEAIFQGIMIILSIILIKNNMLTITSFIAIFMYRNNIFTFATKFSILLNNIKQFNLSFERILSILDYDCESFGSTIMKDYKGNIKFKNVSFSYDKKILDDVSFNINKNDFIIITGGNGVGKTTILSLISKIILPNSGSIYLDNYDISTLSEDSIRNNISVISQKPFLFNMSIKDNLVLINDDFEKIKNVCKKVGLDKKIKSLENGYDTILSEDAFNLSGGEMQKLAIARVLLSNSKVILIDEITNNLDKKAKDDIINILKELKGKYTIVMVTHDKDLLKLSDKIYEIKGGKIEVGD